MTPTQKILERAKFVPDVEDSCGDSAFEACVNAGNAGRARESEKLLPIITSLLSVIECQRSALEDLHFMYKQNVMEEFVVAAIDRAEKKLKEIADV
jgi:hypothetical protein